MNLQYDGSNFYGWAKQPQDIRTIQKELEKFISKELNQEIHVQVAGRTDRFVHAKDQYATFETFSNIDEKKLRRSINSYFTDIYINVIKPIDSDFQPRFDVSKKTYKYVLQTKRTMFSDKKENYQWNYYKKLDVRQLNKLALHLIGQHNFMSFTAKETYNNFVRTIDHIWIVKKHNKIIFYFESKGFMKYQVRKMVGALVACASGKITEDRLKDYLVNPKIGYCSYAAPGQGLYLYKIEYKNFINI